MFITVCNGKASDYYKMNSNKIFKILFKVRHQYHLMYLYVNRLLHLVYLDDLYSDMGNFLLITLYTIGTLCR